MRRRERHGFSRTSTYTAWAMMKQRCLNSNHIASDRYAGRNIGVCDRWKNSFVAFLADMGEKPEGMTLERVDNDGDYCPENCKWATRKEQSRNTRRTRKVTVNGETKLATDVASENGISAPLVSTRISNGWPVEEAIGLVEHHHPRAITLGDETRTMAQWAEKTGVSRQAVSQRLQWGWPLEKALLEPRGSKFNVRHFRGRGKESTARRKTVSFRLGPEQLQKLDSLVKSSGLNQGEIIRRLIDSAMIRPPAVLTSAIEEKVTT